MEKNTVESGTGRVISVISSIRNGANKFLVAKLNEAGLKGLATSHGDILSNLFKSSPMSMQELAAKVGKDKSTMTALVDKLTAGGYLVKEKSTEDSRITMVSLTQKGLELKPAVNKISVDLLDIAYRGFSPEDKKELLRLLSMMDQNFKDPI